MVSENPTDKYAVSVENNGNIVGYLTNGNNGYFSKTFLFLRELMSMDHEKSE